MNRDDWTQNLMYVCVAGASVSMAFLLSLRFVGHARAQQQQAQPAQQQPQQTQAAPPPSTPAPPGNAAQGAGQVPPAGAAATPGSAPNLAPPPAPGDAPKVPAAADSQPSEVSKLEGFLEPFIYDIVNRRDPFMAYAEYVPQDGGPQARPLSPAQRFDLDQLRLVGVMWDIKDPKAMFMDPNSEVMVLGRDEGIGNRNGYIASIREGEVVVVEAIRKRGDVVYKTRVLHMER